MQSYHSDNPKALTKRKELDVHQALTAAGVEFEYQKHLPFRGCGLQSETAHCFLDFAIEKPWGVVILECDELQHTSYDPSCDVRRDFDICTSLALGSGHKAVVLHYNPDAFKVAGVTRRTSKKDREAKLVQTLAVWDNDPAPELGFARFFLYYDADSDDSQLPSVAQHWEEPAKQMSFRLQE